MWHGSLFSPPQDEASKRVLVSGVVALLRYVLKDFASKWVRFLAPRSWACGVRLPTALQVLLSFPACERAPSPLGARGQAGLSSP